MRVYSALGNRFLVRRSASKSQGMYLLPECATQLCTEPDLGYAHGFQGTLGASHNLESTRCLRSCSSDSGM